MYGICCTENKLMQTTLCSTKTFATQTTYIQNGSHCKASKLMSCLLTTISTVIQFANLLAEFKQKKIFP